MNLHTKEGLLRTFIVVKKEVTCQILMIYKLLLQLAYQADFLSLHLKHFLIKTLILIYNKISLSDFY